MNIQRWRQFDFSLGVQDATTWLLKKPNELARGINLRFTEKVGGFERRPGFVRAGDTFGTDLTPQGGHIAKFSTGSRRFVAVNNDGGTATIIRVQDSDTGTWSDLADTPAWPVDSVLFFKDYLDEVYVSGFDPATGDPIEPANIDKDLDVSTTRNLSGAPRGYFFEEYLGLLYLANVLVNGERHKDRVYKSSPPLGAMTFIQGAQEDPLTDATLINNVPPMTSNTAPSGVVASSSQYDATWAPWKAFNRILTRTAGSWFTQNTVTTGWVRYDFGAGNEKAITHYSIVGIATDASSDAAVAAKNWNFEGSNDGTNWTTLHSVTNAPAWGQGEKRYYTTTNTTAYRYYRVNITANQGSTEYTGLTGLELLTSLQGTRSIKLKLDSVRYVKVNQTLDIYKAGTETKLFTVTPTAVEKDTNSIILDPFMESFATGAVNTTDNTITLTGAATALMPTGTTVKFDSSATIPAGLTVDTIYYVIYVNATTIKLATSLENAQLGIAVDITSTGSGTHRIRLSYSFNDNDEIWLTGTKGKLNIFWNTDYPNPQATGEYLHIKPGTAAAPQITGIGASSNRLFIFTKHSGTRWDGQNLVTFNRSVGCISHRSIGNIDDDWLLWVDAKGNVRARSENAGAQENISRAIRNQWMRKLTQEQLKAVSVGIVGQVAKFNIGAVDNKWMRVVYDFEANTWSPERLAYPALIQADDDYTGELKPYFFSSNGCLYMDEEGDLDDNKNIAFEAGTGRDMFGTEQTKKFEGILLFTKNCSGLRLQAAVDGGQMKTIGRIEGEVCYMKFPEQGDSILPRGVSIDWQIMGSNKGSAPEVEGAVVYWIPEENVPSERRTR